jgi:hypothetical protein
MSRGSFLIDSFLPIRRVVEHESEYSKKYAIGGEKSSCRSGSVDILHKTTCPRSTKAMGNANDS